MTPKNFQDAKARLDKFISKQRIAMYKPIQIAEILYRVRLQKDGMNLEAIDNLENYRNPSKKWRDEITKRLINQVSTSSQKYQDNLFDNNAIPPGFIRELALINNQFSGVVERYIYQNFRRRQKIIFMMLEYIEESINRKREFELKQFLSFFTREQGIRRSIDKAYEIVVYALFNSLLHHLQIEVRISANPERASLLQEFEEFTRLLLGLDSQTTSRVIDARLYRAGTANIADRGLDMWANFGPAIQVKHVSLSEEFAEEVSSEVGADEIVIVCKDAEAEMINRVCEQLGCRLRGIIQESQLIEWYQQALNPKRTDSLAETLLKNLREQFKLEFSYSSTFEDFYKERGYDAIPQPNLECPFWEPDA